eukprot:CAMPEP_0180453516 /NCGR_PEP_ID=MMETSP1036_2-20121128/19808_1 /TAXON_ID=632150 /ORGANISM="Azadinium spinosum, Strain 3D9" /LENGTH=186 /DNA_ID=CAMNT_0022460017 /DNA_START=3 /DNA_END=560 /DNA_ORIENTATION=-
MGAAASALGVGAAVRKTSGEKLVTFLEAVLPEDRVKLRDALNEVEHRAISQGPPEASNNALNAIPAPAASASEKKGDASEVAKEEPVHPKFLKMCALPGGYKIERTEMRGMTLVQLGLVKVFLEENCVSEKWSGAVMDGNTLREAPLKPEMVNLYHACDWIIKPATAGLKCSFVELVAGGPQKPKW